MQMLGVGEQDTYLLCEMRLEWRGQQAGMTLHMAQGLRHPVSECSLTSSPSMWQEPGERGYCPGAKL